LDSVGGFELPLSFAIHAAWFVAALALVLMVDVLVLRFRNDRRERRRVLATARWREVISEVALGGQVAVPPPTSADLGTFLDEWNGFHQTLEGEAREHLNRLARDLGIGASARRLLASRGRRERLLGIITLGNLRDGGCWDLLARIAGSPRTAESLAASRALAQIDPRRAMILLLPQVTTREDWSAPRVSALLEEAEQGEVCTLLGETLETVEPARLTRLLRFIEELRCDVPLERIERVLARSDDPATAAACLGLLVDPRGVAIARRHLDHPAWFVRVHAVSAIGRLGGEEERGLLLACLADPEWWVRYRAAQALGSLPGGGVESLDALRSQVNDRFARDILSQVVAEGRLE
jgi:hypothetical protein